MIPSSIDVPDTRSWGQKVQDFSGQPMNLLTLSRLMSLKASIVEEISFDRSNGKLISEDQIGALAAISQCQSDITANLNYPNIGHPEDRRTEGSPGTRLRTARQRVGWSISQVCDQTIYGERLWRRWEAEAEGYPIPPEILAWLETLAHYHRITPAPG